MAENTSIAWCDHTFNPVLGCTKVAPGCTNCYAEALMDTRFGKVQWGPNGTRVKTSEANWFEPLKWNRAAERVRCDRCDGCGDYEGGRTILTTCEQCNGTGVVGPDHRPRVFCASLADVFEDWVGSIVDHNWIQLWRCENCNGTEPMTAKHAGHLPLCDCDGPYRPLTMADLRRDLFALIDATPHLDWLLLTKRPENIRRMWPPCTTCHGNGRVDMLEHCPTCDGKGDIPLRKNVWLLTSVSENAGRLLSKKHGTWSPWKTEHPKGEDPKEWPADFHVCEFPSMEAV